MDVSLSEWFLVGVLAGAGPEGPLRTRHCKALKGYDILLVSATPAGGRRPGLPGHLAGFSAAGAEGAATVEPPAEAAGFVLAAFDFLVFLWDDEPVAAEASAVLVVAAGAAAGAGAAAAAGAAAGAGAAFAAGAGAAGAVVWAKAVAANAEAIRAVRSLFMREDSFSTLRWTRKRPGRGQ